MRFNRKVGILLLGAFPFAGSAVSADRQTAYNADAYRELLSSDIVVALLWALTLILVRQLSRRRIRSAPCPAPQDVLGLVEILRDFGVEERAGLYLYVPAAPTPETQAVSAWLIVLKSAGIVGGGPYCVPIERMGKSLAKTHPHLFSGEPSCFYVYRLKRRRLEDWLDKIISNPKALSD